MIYRHMKKVFWKIFVVCMIFSMPVTAEAKTETIMVPVKYNNIRIVVNGKELNVSKEPFIYEGTTYLPIRAVAEAVGMDVSWNKDTQTVLLKKSKTAVASNKAQTKQKSLRNEKTNILIQYNDIKIVADGKKVETAQEPFVYEGTTYLPVRAVAESVGMQVKWEGSAKIVSLTNGQNAKQESTSALKQTTTGLETVLGAEELPDYWKTYLSEKIRWINDLQKAGGSDSFSFIAMTDIHESTNLGKRTGAVAKAIMDGCNMKYALVLGDVVAREALATEQLMNESFKRAESILSPIRDRALQVEGNHDGAWGIDATDPYNHRFSETAMEKYIYKKVAAVEGVVFSDNSNAYYADDKEKKFRYIMLNTHLNDGKTYADGRSKNNPFNLARFGQAQYDFLVNEALNVPDGWTIFVSGHVAVSNEPYPMGWWGDSKDNAMMRKILVAYNNRETFTGNITGTYGADAASVSADFRNAKGKVVAFLAGHQHVDSIEVADGLPIITIRCDAHEEAIDGNPLTTEDDRIRAEKIKGTVTEQSFDVFTVDPSSKTIYITKIGAGEDREFAYK